MAGDIVVSPEVFYRDNMGRFAAAVDEGIEDALEDIGQRGVGIAGGIAPQIGDTIMYEVGGTTVFWFSTHEWAMAFEEGIPMHIIEPSLDHNKLASKERGFGPVSGPVMHPGMDATHFLTESYAVMASQALAIFAAHIPG